jgi:hypothetical protein
MNQQQTWVTTARIDTRSSARRVLIALFWIWGLLGLLANGIAFVFLTGNVGVENLAAHLTETMLFWIGGMILFGVGAAAVPISYEFKMDTPAA